MIEYACKTPEAMAHWLNYADPLQNTRPCWQSRSTLPMGGDAVRLASPWEWGDCPKGSLPVGSIGIIGGYTDQTDTPGYDDYVSITFHTVPFIGREGSSAELCSCSGGPGTIATPVGELVATDEVIQHRAWKWKDGHARAHNGLEYTRDCRVWLWYPSNR